MIKRILSIAGSDCSGGAGIQADIKTITALGGYAMTAITAITAQNTVGVASVYPLSADLVEQQLKASIEDIGVDAIKIGMLGNETIMRRVSALVLPFKEKIPVVIDPVMSSTTGASLLESTRQEAFWDFLTSGTLITPNISEAEKLLGKKICGKEDMEQAAYQLHGHLNVSVLLKGGHMAGKKICDVLKNGQQLHEIWHDKIPTRHTHGTGCTLSSAVAFNLAEGEDILTAVQHAGSYVHGAIQNAPALGRGDGPLWHGWNNDF